MDRFDLFLLPAVAISEVMKMFHIFDLTILSMCSQRTQKRIKHFRGHRKEVEISIGFYQTGVVRVLNKTGTENFILRVTALLKSMKHSVKLGNSTVQMCMKRNGTEDWIHLQFDDRIEGLKVITVYLCSFFEKDVTNMYLSNLTSPQIPQKIMEWVTRRQKNFQVLKTKGENVTDKIAAYLLDNVKYGSTVIFDLKLTPNFKSNFKFEGQYLDVYNAFWFTLDNLISMNCSTLIVRDSKLTNKKMNTFLKYWMSNDFKYAEICVDMEELQLEILFDGIPTMERNADVKRMYRIDERGSHFILGGIDIKRGNGMTATIVYNEAVIKARALWMIVWDNISI